MPRPYRGLSGHGDQMRTGLWCVSATKRWQLGFGSRSATAYGHPGGGCRRLQIAIVLLAMVNQVLGRILRSERTASLRCPIVKQQRAANAEVIVNLKTVPIPLLLGCAGTDCGYPNVRFWRISEVP